MEDFKWVKAFGVSEENLQNWTKEIPENEFLLLWCLKNNKIDEKEYLEWARNRYGLASINEDFFEKNSPPPFEMWKKYMNSGPWSKLLLPFLEWENIVFILCLEPPKEKLELNFSAQFLLTSNRVLEMCWKSFKENLVSLFSQTENLQNNQKLSNSSEHEKTETKIETPENINQKWSSTKVSTLPSANNPPPPPSFTHLVPSASSPKSFNKIDLAAKSVSLRPFGVSNFTEEQIQDNDSLVNWVFQQMSPYFSSVIWLLLKDKNLSCWRYTNNLDPKDLNQKVDCNQPSVFRITLRTGLSYHGYITSSSVNDQFFDNWRFEAHPEHITACPIKKEKEIIGILVGIGDANSNTNKVLFQTEKIVEKIQFLWAKLQFSE